MWEKAVTYLHVIVNTVGSKIWKHLKSSLFEGWISTGQALAMAIAQVPTIQKQTLLSDFQMVIDKMAVICPDIKWLGFQIPTICNPTSY